MTTARLIDTRPASAATAPAIIRGSDGSRVTMADLSAGIRGGACYYVVPPATTDQQIAQAREGGGDCAYATVQRLPVGSLLVDTECINGAVERAFLEDGWSALALEVWERGVCGTGRLDALELAIDRACEMVRARQTEGSERVE